MIPRGLRFRVGPVISPNRDLRIVPSRNMASVRPSIPHELRTAAEPREEGLQGVVIANIKEVNDNVSILSSIVWYKLMPRKVRLLRLFPVINRTIKVFEKCL